LVRDPLKEVERWKENPPARAHVRRSFAVREELVERLRRDVQPLRHLVDRPHFGFDLSHHQDLAFLSVWYVRNPLPPRAQLRA
jgi:hypothetical protein